MTFRQLFVFKKIKGPGLLPVNNDIQMYKWSLVKSFHRVFMFAFLGFRFIGLYFSSCLFYFVFCPNVGDIHCLSSRYYTHPWYLFFNGIVFSLRWLFVHLSLVRFDFWLLNHLLVIFSIDNVKLIMYFMCLWLCVSIVSFTSIFGLVLRVLFKWEVIMIILIFIILNFLTSW